MEHLPDDVLIVFFEHDEENNLIVATNDKIGLRVEVKDLAELEEKLRGAIAERIAGKDTLKEFGFPPDIQPILMPKLDKPMTFVEFASVFGGQQARDNLASLPEKLASGQEGIEMLDAVLSGGSQLEAVTIAQVLAEIDDPKTIDNLIEYVKKTDDLEKPMKLFGMLSRKNDYLLEKLLNWFQDASAPNRRAALIGLGYFPSARTDAIFDAALQDNDPEVVEVAQVMNNLRNFKSQMGFGDDR